MNRHKHGDPLRSVLHTPEPPDSYICSNCKVRVTEAHHDKYPECLSCWYKRTSGSTGSVRTIIAVGRRVHTECSC